MNKLYTHKRLVVDSSKKPRINKDYFNGRGFKPLHIDFNNFESGGTYVVPYCVDGFELLGRRYVVYRVTFDEKTGVVFAYKPIEAVFVVGKNNVDRDISLLRGFDDSLIFFGSCWSNTRVFKIYDIKDKERAISDYNSDIQTMIDVRNKYLTELRDKELKGLSKFLV